MAIAADPTTPPGACRRGQSNPKPGATLKARQRPGGRGCSREGEHGAPRLAGRARSASYSLCRALGAAAQIPAPRRHSRPVNKAGEAQRRAARCATLTLLCTVDWRPLPGGRQLSLLDLAAHQTLAPGPGPTTEQLPPWPLALTEHAGHGRVEIGGRVAGYSKRG